MIMNGTDDKRSKSSINMHIDIYYQDSWRFGDPINSLMLKEHGQLFEYQRSKSSVKEVSLLMIPRFPEPWEPLTWCLSLKIVIELSQLADWLCYWLNESLDSFFLEHFKSLTHSL